MAAVRGPIPQHPLNAQALDILSSRTGNHIASRPAVRLQQHDTLGVRLVASTHFQGAMFHRSSFSAVAVVASNRFTNAH
jgi:hypothetical protein